MPIRYSCKSRDNGVIVVGMFKEQPRALGIVDKHGHAFPPAPEYFLCRDYWFRPKMEDMSYSLNRLPLDEDNAWTTIIENIEHKGYF